MHLSEGVLPAPVLAGAGALAAAGVAYGLRRIAEHEIPRVAILTSAFFVASMIRVPVGVSSSHLVLNGLAGLILGWAAVPGLFVALLLQAAVFFFGGLPTLGVNTLIMAAPAVVVRYAFGGALRRAAHPGVRFVVATAAGASAVALSAILAASFLLTAGQALAPTAGLLLAANLPAMAADGVITGAVVHYLAQVRPALLGIAGPRPAAPG
jgi:cobalt/nickel transport system permease protein